MESTSLHRQGKGKGQEKGAEHKHYRTGEKSTEAYGGGILINTLPAPPNVTEK